MVFLTWLCLSGGSVFSQYGLPYMDMSICWQCIITIRSSLHSYRYVYLLAVYFHNTVFLTWICLSVGSVLSQYGLLYIATGMSICWQCIFTIRSSLHGYVYLVEVYFHNMGSSSIMFLRLLHIGLLVA